MIDRIVSFAMSQRLMVVIAIVALSVWGVISFQRLPIDAYPDLAPPRVQVISQWPGHASEEVERLITIPLEVEMNGIPHLEVLRSISLYGLSSITMNFEYGTDPYFAREQAFERIPNATVPDGVTPQLGPLYSPSGLIYRYTLQSPDRSTQDLKILNDWVLSRKYRSIPGVADLSGLGGTTMQYQVQIDPRKLFAYGINVQQLSDQLAANNATAPDGTTLDGLACFPSPDDATTYMGLLAGLSGKIVGKTFEEAREIANGKPKLNCLLLFVAGHIVEIHFIR